MGQEYQDSRFRLHLEWEWVIAMTTNKAAKLLAQKFGPYGLSKKAAERAIVEGVNRGMTAKQCYDIVRYTLSKKTGKEETFSVDDIVGMTGLSKEEVFKKLSDGIDTMSDEELAKSFMVSDL